MLFLVRAYVKYVFNLMELHRIDIMHYWKGKPAWKTSHNSLRCSATSTCKLCTLVSNCICNFSSIFDT